MPEEDYDPREKPLETISSFLGERVGRRVIGVTGLFGAWLNQVSFRLEEAGASVLWPAQDLRLHGAEHKYVQNGENIELLQMHDSIMEECCLDWFTYRRPRFYDLPFPGPEEYLAKFPEDGDVILTDNKLCFFLPLWQNYITDLIVIKVAEEDSEAMLRSWAPHVERKDRIAVVNNYRQSLEGDLGLVDKVWYIDNYDLKHSVNYNVRSSPVVVGKENHLEVT
jgi:hypothetical protein